MNADQSRSTKTYRALIARKRLGLGGFERVRPRRLSKPSVCRRAGLRSKGRSCGRLERRGCVWPSRPSPNCPRREALSRHRVLLRRPSPRRAPRSVRADCHGACRWRGGPHHPCAAPFKPRRRDRASRRSLWRAKRGSPSGSSCCRAPARSWCGSWCRSR
jgi:hypothetical protein